MTLAVDRTARDAIDALRSELAEVRTNVNRTVGAVGRLEGKVDACILDVRASTSAQRDTADKVMRLDHAFRKQFGSLSEEVTEVIVSHEARAKRNRTIAKWSKKLAAGAAIGFVTVLGAAGAMALLKHCGLTAPNTVEVQP